MKCLYCNQPSRGTTSPLMCDAHTDLAVVGAFLMEDLQREPTVLEVESKVAAMRQRRPDLAIMVEDVPELMSSPGFVFDYEPVTHTVT